jgi:hypothetical protein
MASSSRFSRRQSGAALLETLFVLPLLLLLLVGAMEFGFLVQDNFTVQNAVRQGVRIAGSLGTKPQSDYYVLSSISAALKGKMQFVDHIVIYKPNADGSVPGACEVASQTGICTLYTPADFNPLKPVTAWAPSTGCDGFLDAKFCPTTHRQNSYDAATGPDLIGVEISYVHQSVTGLMFDQAKIDPNLNEQLDPDTRTYTP